MKITIFTGSSNRHNFLINSLLDYDLYIISEKKKSFSYLKSKFYKKSFIEKNYFKKVFKSEKKIFGNSKLNEKNLKKIKKINYKEINNININQLKSFLNSDLYIIFGSSFIKGDLVNFLVKKRAINIHLGISPYYRGSNCNFWASVDKNFNLVGATIHLINKEIDEGKILYHSFTEYIKNPIDYSMASVKGAILSLKEKINDGSIFKIKGTKQNRKLLIRFSKNSNLSEDVFKKYPKKVIFKKRNKKLFINPVMLRKNEIYVIN